ncbi:response regulator transcription factor [Mycobacterium sp. OTB74]|jgi:DNA-binding NarL/FixJ family response regulator|uniref:DNA-binding response regulator n=1 Tax=Mycobacterium sp. OTB74 TaxID=1853452 RepID=UPI00247361DB|nr:response regulator transcription factor [Mycobacterium sp. OTB74]MDH6243491.1 DNA-binding NarL/FixJ family response regulator [Mycobacterium sp. OTB74]
MIVTAENASPSAIRAAIIDDHDVVHAGVQAWCAHADPAIEFVGNYLDPAEFVQHHPSSAHDVDVVLFDLQIDGNKPEFEALKDLCAAGYRVIIFSHINSDEVILHCLDLGAITYLVKSEGRAHLIEAIQSASSATPYLGPRMARALLNDDDTRRPNLSVREKEVLVAWFQTESKDLVGKRLFIAPSTVRTHLQRARAKYAAVGRSAPTKSALLARAIEDGILSLSDL